MSGGSISEEFSDLGIEIEDKDVLDQLEILCQRYNIDSIKISCEYFAFSSKHKLKVGQPPTIDILSTFENEKLKNLKSSSGVRRPLDPIEGAENLPDCPDLASPGTPVRLTTAKRGAFGVVTPENHLSKKFVTAIGSPVVNLSAPSTPTIGGSQTSGARYTERTNKGEIVTKHNEDLQGDWGNILPAKISEVGSLKQPYKFMFERLRDKAAVLDETICRVGDKLIQKLDFNQDELLDLATTQSETAVGLGRVQCDSEGRLNSNSVVLHGSLDTSSGAAVTVDLSQTPSFSLFPGQVVAVDCTNPNGSKLVVSKVYEGVTPPLAECTLPTSSTLTILVATGPYTTSDNTSMDPLQDIMDVVKEKKPSVVLLLGPFVDLKNSAMCNGNESFDIQWCNMLSLMSKEIGELETQLILVPSSRDAIGYPVYPQPPFPASSLYTPNMKCVTDPCILNISGVQVALTSSDILFHLGKEEISFPPRSGDRMSRLSSHLLQQGSMYPLYPPNEEMNIDYERMELHCLLEKAPHLLILPSDLVHFVRDLSGTTVLNPGRITKGIGPGTYGFVSMRRGEGESLETKVDIVRI